MCYLVVCFALAIAFISQVYCLDSTICNKPYSCITATACSKAHPSGLLKDAVLFQCGQDRLCCPPKQNAPETVTQGRITLPTTRFAEPWEEPEDEKSSQATTSIPLNTNQASMRPISTEKPPLRPFTTTTKSPNFTRISISSVTIEKWTRTTEAPRQTSTKKSPDITKPSIPMNNSVDFSVHGFALPWEHKNKGLLPENCGVSITTNKIIEGDDASIGEFPWMALIGFTGFNGATGFVCGGTLINERYVLTAAHCLRKDGAKLTHVRLGEHDLSSLKDCTEDVCLDPAMDFTVEKIITHERWDKVTYRNDIGLIRLNTSVLERGLPTVAPICLPFSGVERNKVANFSKYEAVGWGLTGWREHVLSDILQKTLLEHVSIEACNAAICPDERLEVPYCPILSGQICVQGSRKRDVCKGDSGGPLMTYTEVNTVQIGITSFKATEVCGEENIPSVFTRVDKYLEWILDHMEP